MLNKSNIKTLIQLFSLVVTIVIIMFIFNYLVYSNSTLSMYNQMRENNELVIKSMIYSFDNCFRTVNDIIYNISILPYELYDPNGHHNLDAFNTYKLERQIAEVIYPYDFIDELIVFFSFSDLVITSKGTMSFDSLFQDRYRNSKYASEFWRNFAVTRHPMKYIPSDWYSDATYNATLSTYNRLNKRKLIGIIGSNQMATSDMNILIFVDEEKLLKHVLQKNIMTGTLIVLDQDKNTIFSVGDETDLINIEGAYYSKSETSANQGAYDYYSIVSDYNNFVYVNRVSNAFANLFPIVKTNQVILANALLIGIVASGLLAYSIVWAYKRRNQDIESKLNIYKNDIRNSLLHKMSALYHGDDKRRLNTYFKEFFNNQNFFLVSFNIGLFRDNFNAKNKKRTEKYQSRYSLEGVEGINNIIFKHLQTEFKDCILAQTTQNEFIAMIGIDFGVKRSVVLEKVDVIHKNLLRDLQGECNVLIAVSNIYSEIGDYKKAQMDLLMCMGYRKVNDNSVVLDTQKIEYVTSTFFPLHEIEKLRGHMLSGNSEECEKTIKNIISENFAKNINCYKYINILTAIFLTIIETLLVYKYPIDEIERIEKEYFKMVRDYINLENIQTFLLRTISHIAERIQMESQNKLNKEFIIKYINLHYNENLYLDNMAELLGTSPKYFSNLFKKLTGTNFVEYLNKTRISHAREYLKSTVIPISEIGEKVGYINPSTFTSTFRKYCGISPTEYRKRHNKG